MGLRDEPRKRVEARDLSPSEVLITTRFLKTR